MPSIVWKGNLTFGLVSIPVKLYRAARRERVAMHYVHQAQPVVEERAAPSEEPPASEESSPASSPGPVTRVRQSLVSADDEQPVRREEVLRGYEVEPDRYVVLQRDELKRLQRRTSPNMEIV